MVGGEGFSYLAANVHPPRLRPVLAHGRGPDARESFAQVVQENDLQPEGERQAAVDEVVRPARVFSDQSYVDRLPARAGFFPGIDEAASGDCEDAAD